MDTSGPALRSVRPFDGDVVSRIEPWVVPIVRRPPPGVPRDQVTVPICRAPALSDEALYDDPTGTTVRYLPRWRVVEPSFDPSVL